MKKMVMLMVMVALSATLPVVGEVIWPGGDVKIVTGNCAKTEVKDGVVYVTATESRPNVWPAAYFTFPSARDFSNIAEVRVTFTNCCAESLRLSAKIKADTEQGQLPQGSVSVQPLKERTYRLKLFIDNWVFDAPHGLVGLKRNPFVRKGSSFSLAKTHSVSVFLPAGTCGKTFGVSRVELVPSERDAEPEIDGHAGRVTLLWEQLSRANRVRFCPSASCVVSLVSSWSPFCQFASASKKSVVSSSYSQSAAFAALASYGPSSGVQSTGRTSMQGHARTHLGRDVVTS